MWLDDIDPELEVTPLLDSGTDCRAAHYMTAMGLWRPPIAPGIQGSLPVAACEACMSSGACFPEMPQRAGGKVRLIILNSDSKLT